jgi:hypothetical protein
MIKKDKLIAACAFMFAMIIDISLFIISLYLILIDNNWWFIFFYIMFAYSLAMFCSFKLQTWQDVADQTKKILGIK